MSFLTKIVSNSPNSHGCILWKTDTACGYAIGNGFEKWQKDKKTDISSQFWFENE